MTPSQIGLLIPTSKCHLPALVAFLCSLLFIPSSGFQFSASHNDYKASIASIRDSNYVDTSYPSGLGVSPDHPQLSEGSPTNAIASTIDEAERHETDVDSSQVDELKNLLLLIDAPRRSTGMVIEDPSHGNMPSFQFIYMLNFPCHDKDPTDSPRSWLSWIPPDKIENVTLDDIPDNDQQAERWARYGRQPHESNLSHHNSLSPQPDNTDIDDTLNLLIAPPPVSSDLPDLPSNNTVGPLECQVKELPSVKRRLIFENSPQPEMGRYNSTTKEDQSLNGSFLKPTGLEASGVSPLESQIDPLELEQINQFIQAEDIGYQICADYFIELTNNLKSSNHIHTDQLPHFLRLSPVKN
ncbi:hypothetical protein O181_059941 [Austropuccinia psidii MF-1]|uniref:Uncharacterized protein n=1 Tax=Austropuccinia psidii MF-1 TaxID=1389203 RepID=A0A9Q3HW49_9BASI|nr:hypothetical protein [Austropuccinia psidii MF-1]